MPGGVRGILAVTARLRKALKLGRPTAPSRYGAAGPDVPVESDKDAIRRHAPDLARAKPRMVNKVTNRESSSHDATAETSPQDRHRIESLIKPVISDE